VVLGLDLSNQEQVNALYTGVTRFVALDLSGCTGGEAALLAGLPGYGWKEKDSLKKHLVSLILPESVHIIPFPVTSNNEPAYQHKVTSYSWNNTYGLFYEFTFLRSVEMPGVTEIGQYSFYGCTALARVVAPEIAKLGDNAFAGCAALAEMSIAPENTAYVFVDGKLMNKSQTTLILYAGATDDMTLPATITKIGNSAFAENNVITTLVLPGIVTIADNAFESCTSLKTVDLPDATTLQKSAFSGCSSLTSISIPQLSSIGPAVFAGCAALVEITLAADNPKYASANGLLLSADKTTLIAYPNAEKGMNIPASVKKIGASAFQNPTKLPTKMDLRGITEIGMRSFWNNFTLSEVSLPDITVIGDAAFSYGSVKAVILPAKAPALGENAFSGSNGAVFYVPDSAASNYGAGVDGWTDELRAKVKPLSQKP
jgi:hypothetical protein